MTKDRRRLLEHQKKYGNPATKIFGDPTGGGSDGSGASVLGISKVELDESGVILVSLAGRSNTAADVSGRSSSRTMSLADRFRAAVGQDGASLVLFAPECEPRSRMCGTMLARRR